MKATLEKKTEIFFAMMVNAYRDEEDHLPTEKIEHVPGNDFMEDLTAILCAAKVFAGKILGNPIEDDDLIGFTHLLNRLAIQTIFNSESWDEENTTTVELNEKARAFEASKENE